MSAYQLDQGVSFLLKRGATTADVRSVISEFSSVVASKLSCIDNEENVESRIAAQAVTNLIAAMNARLDAEDALTSSSNRRIDNAEKIRKPSVTTMVIKKPLKPKKKQKTSLTKTGMLGTYDFQDWLPVIVS